MPLRGSLSQTGLILRYAPWVINVGWEIFWVLGVSRERHKADSEIHLCHRMHQSNPVTFTVTCSIVQSQPSHLQGHPPTSRATHRDAATERHTHTARCWSPVCNQPAEPAAVASSQHPALTPFGIAAKPSPLSPSVNWKTDTRHPAAGANLQMRAHDTPLVCVLV